ncbi:MAG: hypothetical protein ABIJ65_12270 [Chloroflexota bacterium]
MINSTQPAIPITYYLVGWVEGGTSIQLWKNTSSPKPNSMLVLGFAWILQEYGSLDSLNPTCAAALLINMLGFAYVSRSKEEVASAQPNLRCCIAY